MRTLFFIIFICQAFHILGQQATVFGIIRDIDNNQGIDFVTVYVEGTKNVSESDLSGQYSIKIPSETNIRLIFSRIGYSDFVLELSPMTNGVKRNINIKLVPKSLDLEITVKAGRIEDVGNVREEVTELKLLPNASGNFESVLPSIALGVSSGSGGELSSQYNVRGGNYDENLVYVNDFEIFRPQLIRGGQQEGLSFPNIDLIRDLEFSSGGFESKYGDKMASVLDIRYKRPEEFRASVGASFLGASIHLEGSKRLGANAYNKFRYLLGARYKSNAYLLGSQDIKGEYVPRFSDIQAFLSYDLTKTLQLGFISNFNRSVYNFVPTSGKSKTGNFSFQIELNTSFEGLEKDEFTYGMSGLSLTYVPEKRKYPLYMKWLVSAYRANEDEKFDIIGKYRLSQIEANLGDGTGEEVAVLGLGTQHVNARNFLFNTVYNFEYKGGIEFNQTKVGKTSKGNFVQWSLKYQNEFFEDFLKEWQRLDSADYNIPYLGNEIELQNVVRATNVIQNHKITSYLQNTYRYENSRNEWKITLGSRFSFHHLASEFLVSPRLQVLYKPLTWKRDIAFKLSGGYYVQPPFYREMRRMDGSINTNLASQKSIHIVGGIAYDFIWEAVSNRPFKIISEIYYKKLNDIVSYEIDNVRIRYAGENNATGYVTGMDFRINGEFVKGAESWVNLSFLRAREAINGIQHKTTEIVDSIRVPKNVADAPRPTDQLFTINMFFQDYLPKNENVKVNLNFSIGSGLPFGPRENNLEYRNAFRLKTYRRVDIGFSFQLWKEEWKTKKPHHFLRFTRNTWVSIEAFNVLNAKNQASVNWIKTLTNVEYALPNNLTGRRINLRFKIDF
ncbi:MAG: TonB-dependent receptor [Saprospiraceae bacterium]|nr:TonB-dependent receptor [Saprospiraceae bacterium]MBP6694253.1 TonB-dependent receptor [Saprospiraceae bacterium]